MEVIVTENSLYWAGKTKDLRPFLRALAERHLLLGDLITAALSKTADPGQPGPEPPGPQPRFTF